MIMNSTQDILTTACPLAPEDVRPGDYVTRHDVIVEIPSFMWCGDATLLPPHEPVRSMYRANDAGEPLRVAAVCVPYVLVRPVRGRQFVLDLRKVRLARLDLAFGMQAWMALKAKSPSDMSRKKRKKRRKKKKRD